MCKYNEKGQTLIEVIVAIVLCSLILVGVTKLIASSFTNVDFSENQVNASSYAQQGMAYIGNLHDTDYATFSGDIGKKFCLDDNTPPDFTQDNGSTDCVSGLHPNITTANGAKYIRSIDLVSGGSCSGNTQVTVTVQWNDKDCCPINSPTCSNQYCHNSQLVSCYEPAL